MPAIDIAVNAEPAGAFGTFTADEILQIDGDDLIDQFGPRAPDFASSQKNSKGAFVGISSEPLNQATMTFLDRLSQGFSGTAFGCSTTLDFNEATGGVASMETLIERVTVFEDRFEDEQAP